MKKRMISLIITAAMILSLLPTGVLAARDDPWMCISLPEMGLVECGEIMEGAEFPEGLSYSYDASRDVHVLTMEDMYLTESLAIDGQWDAELKGKIEIVLKGTNVIDTRERDYGEFHNILMINSMDAAIISGSEGASLSLMGYDCSGICSNNGVLTIDGAKISTDCKIDAHSEGGQGFSGGSDYVITGGAELDLYGEWMGIIISGTVTFEDCTVNTNRIHVHSHTEEDEFGNVTSDQRTMTVGEGAVVNINAEGENEDSALMLLDGSTLKIAGGVLNCNFENSPSGHVQVGYDGDCAMNTVLLESGEWNVTANPEWWDAVYMDQGRLVQTGGKLNVSGAMSGLTVGNMAYASFEGGEAVINNSGIGICAIECAQEWEGDRISLSGTDMTIDVNWFGIAQDSGRSSITGGNIDITASPEDGGKEQAIYTGGKLVMSGGTVSVDTNGIGLLVDLGGEFILQGGKMDIKTNDRGPLIACGLTDLRGGELDLKGNSQAFVGIPSGGDYLHIGEGMFLRTEDAYLVERDEEEEGAVCAYYVTAEDEICTEISFGTTGGVFAGELDVAGSEMSVGVPFVVSADLALGENSGTAVFTLPEGVAVKGGASVNGVAVDSVYSDSEHTLTVPLDTQIAAIRFYAVAEQTLENAEVSCAVSVGEKTHTLTSCAFSATGLRMELPVTVAGGTLPLSGSAAPDGQILVYEVSDEENPAALHDEPILANKLGDFSGSVELPAISAGETTHTYQIRVELWCDGALIDSVQQPVAYASHAAKLKYLNIQNEYHGTKLDEILRNDIVVDYQMGTIAINESTSTKAYNYFPEYPGFFFAAEFEESHANGCCEEGEETSHIISARVEAYGTKGQSVSVPLRYNVEAGRFEGWYEFPDWAPEAFAVYWVEEGVVNRESFYQAAIDEMSTYGGAGWRYEDVLTSTTDEVNNTMEEYFSNVQVWYYGDGRYEYVDADGDRIMTSQYTTLNYSELDLTDGFEDVLGNGQLMVKTESNVEEYSLTMTVAARADGCEPVAFSQSLYLDYVTVDAAMARAVTGATPGQRTTVFLLKQIPRIGDAVQAVDSKLLQDSLIEFDSEFADEMARLTDAITSTMYYRCPYNGKQLARGNTEEAKRILQALLDLQTEYAKEYQENKDAIREDMKESLINGVTLGVNKFGNKTVRTVYEGMMEGIETYEEYKEYAEYLNELVRDPSGTLQNTLSELMTPEGMLNAGVEIAADKGWIDEDTQDLFGTLIDPDGTYQDAHGFMMKYRDKLTELTDAYTLALQKEIQGSGMTDDCKPPEEPEDSDPPELPGDAGGEVTPIPAIKDPSGYVYEAVEGNRLSGVKTTLYYWSGEEAPDENAVALSLQPVDMSGYNQSNPLYTDELGQYQWMVPDGWWQVKYEKEGYETSFSQWLPVPPPQTEVNVGMVRLSQPSFSYQDGDGYLVLDFDTYLEADSVEIGLFVGDEEIYSRVVPQNITLAPDGETRLVSQYVLYYDKEQYPEPTLAQLRVERATTYAGVELDEALTARITLNPSNPVTYSWDGDTCTVALTRELADYIIPWAASYTGDRMNECVLLTTEGAELTGDTVKVIFLHVDDFAPLCPAIPCEREE